MDELVNFVYRSGLTCLNCIVLQMLRNTTPEKLPQRTGQKWFVLPPLPPGYFFTHVHSSVNFPYAKGKGGVASPTDVMTSESGFVGGIVPIRSQRDSCGADGQSGKNLKKSGIKDEKAKSHTPTGQNCKVGHATMS